MMLYIFAWFQPDHFLILCSFSNRCFFTKAISIWTSTGDADHALIVGSYFHYAGGFEAPQVFLYISSTLLLIESLLSDFFTLSF